MSWLANRPLWVLATALTLAGCIGNIGGGGDEGEAVGTCPNGDCDPNFSCDPNAVPSDSPMRRLSHAQYLNTMRDLVDRMQPGAGDTVMTSLGPALSLVPTDAEGDYPRLDQKGSQQHVDGYYEVALGVAQELSADLAGVVGSCATDSDSGNDADCVRDFTERFGMMVLRRPLEDDEITFYSGDVYNNVDSVDAASFAERITVLLLAPQFIFHVEDELPAAEDDANSFPLSSFEIASRLSYHFWNSMPDDELFAAAADGSLATEDGYLAQVERLFNHERTHAVIDGFFAQWLHLDELPPLDASLGTTAYDTFVGSDTPGPDTTHNMVEEVLDLFRHYTWTEEGTLDDVLLSDLSFAKTDDVAAIYGMPVWSEGSEPPAFPEAERGGLLTRAALLATGSTSTLPVQKGVRIRRRILCDELPPPPPDVGDFPDLQPDMTVRERIEELTEQDGSSCLGCHSQVNPLGFPTENYDSLGRLREQIEVLADDGSVIATKPANTTSVPLVTADDDRVANDGLELAQYIVDSDKTSGCVARHYFRFAFGRAEDLKADGCTLDGMRTALKDVSLKEMLRAAALQPEFKLRRLHEAE